MVLDTMHSEIHIYICANGLCRGWHPVQAQLGSLHFAKVHLVSRNVFISYLFHAKFLSLGSAQVYIYFNELHLHHDPFAR